MQNILNPQIQQDIHHPFKDLLKEVTQGLSVEPETLETYLQSLTLANDSKDEILDLLIHQAVQSTKLEDFSPLDSELPL